MAFFSHDFAQKTSSHPFCLTIKSAFHAEPLKLKLFPWTTISELKRKIEKQWEICYSKQRLFLQNLELTRNNKSLATYSLGANTTVYVTTKPNMEVSGSQILLKIYETFNDLLPNFEDFLNTVRQGLSSGYIPKLTCDGTSGTYVLYSQSGQNTALFKPMDEEPFAPHNPRGYTGKLNDPGFRKGILSGESAEREVAAYLLDSEGVYKVPLTVYVEMMGFKSNGIKRGSLQSFVSHSDVAGNFGTGMFPVREVHKIGILDLRLLNCDRNENNILVQRSKGASKMIPIDHGLCLPDCIEIYDYEVVWMSWPQSHEPFGNEELEHILSIDVYKDLKLLRSRLNIREKCLRNFLAVNILLKQAAFYGFTLNQIGMMVYRVQEDEPSMLQKLLQQSRDLHKRIKGLIANKEEKMNGIMYKELVIEEKDFIERLSTTDEQCESFAERNTFMENSIVLKRRASDPEVQDNLEKSLEDKKGKKKKKSEKKEGFDDGFVRYFEGLLKQEFEKIRLKSRSRYFSSEFL